MDLLVSGFFLDKHVVDSEPPVECQTLFDAYIQDVGDNLEDFLWSIGGSGPVIVVVTICK